MDAFVIINNLCLSAYATSSLHHFNQSTCWNLPFKLVAFWIINHLNKWIWHFHYVNGVFVILSVLSNSLIYSFVWFCFLAYDFIQKSTYFFCLYDSTECITKWDQVYRTWLSAKNRRDFIRKSKSLDDAIVHWIYLQQNGLFFLLPFLIRLETIDWVWKRINLFAINFKSDKLKTTFTRSPRHIQT